MVSDPIKKVGIGGRVINYQGDDTIDSLVIPPNLTKPNLQGLFVENLGVTDQAYKVAEVQNVEVKRDAYRRWLLVDMPSSEVWSLSKEFFRSFGFKIAKENQKIGILAVSYTHLTLPTTPYV